MSTLKQRLRDDLVTAMKARDGAAKSTLRMAIAAITNEEVAGSTARELSEAEETAVLTREVNKRRDSAEAYTAGNRPELAAKEIAEAEFLAAYLPARLTERELADLVQQAVDAASADGLKPGMKQLGQIIRQVNTQAAGRADGATIAAMVKAALT